MSNALTDVRARLATIVRSGDPGLLVFSIIPEVVTPPFAYVAPGQPYVSREGVSFGGEIVTCHVGVVVAAGANDRQAEALDGVLLLVLNAIDNDDDFRVVSVDQPGLISINGQQHLAASIEVQTEIHRH